MKIKRFYETGGWNRNIDWNYVKENPDDDSEESNWIKYLQKQIEEIIDDLDDESILEIIDIKGFDMYQGPYASVKIFDKKYQIWSIEDKLFIKNFPVSNTDFVGKPFEISHLLREIEDAGSIELYLDANKFNL